MPLVNPLPSITVGVSLQLPRVPSLVTKWWHFSSHWIISVRSIIDRSIRDTWAIACQELRADTGRNRDPLGEKVFSKVKWPSISEAVVRRPRTPTLKWKETWSRLWNTYSCPLLTTSTCFYLGVGYFTTYFLYLCRAVLCLSLCGHDPTRAVFHRVPRTGYIAKFSRQCRDSKHHRRAMSPLRYRFHTLLS